MLDQELQYYLTNQSDLVKKHNGRYLVIRGDEIVGIYDDILIAYRESKIKYDLGTFMIHKCGPGEENYTSHFLSRAVFA